MPTPEPTPGSPLWPASPASPAWSARPAAAGPRPRVVSLLPSATEALCLAGGRSLLVGRSHECDYPGPGHADDVTPLPVLTAARTHAPAPAPTPGGSVASPDAEIDRQVAALLADGQPLYTLDEDLLRALRPDVILTQDLCAVCSIDRASVERVAARLPGRPRVVSLNPSTFEGVLDDVLTVGEACGLSGPALEAVVGLRERAHRAGDYANAFTDGPSVAVLEWTDPLFAGGHWTPQLVERAGARHPLNPTRIVPRAGAGAGPAGVTLRSAGPSRRISAEDLVASAPQFVVIAPCGYALGEARRAAQTLAGAPWFRALPAMLGAGPPRVAVVDGSQMFNRPGPRLVDAFEWLVGWLNQRPEIMPAGFPWSPLRA